MHHKEECGRKENAWREGLSLINAAEEVENEGLCVQACQADT